MAVQALPIIAGLAIVQVFNQFYKRRRAKREASTNSPQEANHAPEDQSRIGSLTTENNILRADNRALRRRFGELTRSLTLAHRRCEELTTLTHIGAPHLAEQRDRCRELTNIIIFTSSQLFDYRLRFMVMASYCGIYAAQSRCSNIQNNQLPEEYKLFHTHPPSSTR